MQSLCVLLLLDSLALAHLSPALNNMWIKWTIKHGRVYENQTESSFRRSVWMKNFHMVRRHNQEAAAGKHTFTMGLNHLADMTTEEVNEKLNGFRLEEQLLLRNDTFEELSVSGIPAFMDWTEAGLVGPVQDQGQCGSCWAFSALGALEGQIKKKTGKLVPLSEQNLLDCSQTYGNHGCLGGYISKAYSYVISNKGVDSEEFYPYQGKENGTCRYSAKRKAGHCSSYHILPKGNEKQLQAVVASVGPIAVAINAFLPSFQLYEGGVYSAPGCSPVFINHAVLVVGYGTDTRGQDYWLVKNSWGKDWGECGYLQIARNKNNMCGIASFAAYPIV